MAPFVEKKRRKAFFDNLMKKGQPPSHTSWHNGPFNHHYTGVRFPRWVEISADELQIAGTMSGTHTLNPSSTCGTGPEIRPVSAVAKSNPCENVSAIREFLIITSGCTADHASVYVSIPAAQSIYISSIPTQPVSSTWTGNVPSLCTRDT